MKSYRAHAWHNQIAAEVNATERLEEIRANKPSNQITLREKLLAVEITAEQFAELGAVYAKRQFELAAVNAKRQPELDAVNAKRQFELAAVNAKWQPELAAVYAKRQPELDAVNAKRQPELDAVNAKWQFELAAAHTRLCLPNCPWDGETIFTHKDTSGNWCMKDEGTPVSRNERIT